MIGNVGFTDFAANAEEKAHEWQQGAILLGRSLQEPALKIGWKDDRGFMTIASGAGKGRNAIIPNLLTWPGSALVIDPKGTYTSVTAARRGNGGGRVTEFLGQEGHVVDPFKLVPGVKSSRFNPLAVLDPVLAQFKEAVDQVADAIVIARNDDASSHWDEGARMLIAGIIAFLVQKQQGATLADLRRALARHQTDGADDLMREMHACGGLAKMAASLMDAAGENERSAFFAMALRNTDWLESQAMQDTLSGSDFDIRDIKQKSMTVYIVLPPQYLLYHNRFMRVFVNLAVGTMSIGGRSQYPVLMVLDEFCELGRLPLIEESWDLFGGQGLKLWLVIHYVAELKYVYGKKWDAFLTNAGAVQAFGVIDTETAEFLTSRMSKQSGEISSEFRAFEELRKTDKHIVFRRGELPMQLQPISYDKTFPESCYNPEPEAATGGGGAS